MLQAVTHTRSQTVMVEFLPLLHPGIHTLTQANVEELAVKAYPSSVRRPKLFSGLVTWLDQLRARGVVGRCWLDGSFLTEKPEPNDIDLVLFPQWGATPTEEVKLEIGGLLDTPLMKAVYGLDVYIVDQGAQNAVDMTSYWRGWYGFCRDGATAKGIAEVML